MFEEYFQKSKFNFTPEEKIKEHELAKIIRRAINKMTSSEEEKEMLKDGVFNYLLQYEKAYNEHNKIEYDSRKEIEKIQKDLSSSLLN